MIYHEHTTYTRNPESCPDVEAIQFDSPESGIKIAAWISAIRGRGAALYENGYLRVPIVEYPGVFSVPFGWVIYREVFGDRFHAAPYTTFHWQYGVKS